MPRIPVAQDDQQLQVGPSGGLQAGDYGPGVGADLTALGGGLEDAAKQVQQSQRDLAEAGAKQQFAQYTAFRDQTLYTADNAFYNQQGQNVLNSRATTEQSLRDKFEQLNDGLSTPLMKKLFQESAGKEIENDLKGIGTYAGKAAQTYNDQADAGLQYQMQNTFVTAQMRGDDQGAAVALGTLQNNIRAQNERNGVSGTAGQMIEDKAVASAYQNTIRQMATVDGQQAQNFFDIHRADIKDPDITYAIEKELQPYVTDAQAQHALDVASGTGSVANPLAPTSSDDEFAGKVHQVENNTGNPAAKNPRSSAQGPDQFTDQTWLGTMKQHGPQQFADAILKVGNRYQISDQSQASAIWSARNDPTQSHAATIALAHDNKTALGSAGLPVNDGTLYLAHVLGAGGAKRVLSASPDTPIAQVTSQGARDANPTILKGTVSDVVGWAYKQMGGSPGGAVPENAPRKDDLDGTIARIRAQGLPMQIEQKAIEKAEQQASLDKRLLESKQQDAANQAWAVALDPKNTDFHTIQPDVWATIPPEQQRSIMERLDQNAKGKDPAPNPNLYIDLSQKAAAGTLTFAEVQANAAKLPKADFDHFAGLASSIQKGDKKPQVTMDMVNSVVKNAVGSAIPLNNPALKGPQKATFEQTQNQRRYDFQKSLMTDIDVWQQQNPGKHIGATDIQAMADRRLLQTNVGATTGGWFSSATPAPARYQFESGATPGHVRLPTADVQRIRSRGLAVLGRPLTDDEVYQAYEHEARGGL